MDKNELKEEENLTTVVKQNSVPSRSTLKAWMLRFLPTRLLKSFVKEGSKVEMRRGLLLSEAALLFAWEDFACATHQGKRHLTSWKKFKT